MVLYILCGRLARAIHEMVLRRAAFFLFLLTAGAAVHAAEDAASPVAITAAAAVVAAAVPTAIAPGSEDGLRLAEGLVARGFHELAAQELEKQLAGTLPDDQAARAILLLIECRRALGQKEPALALMERFRTRWPDHPRTAALELVRGDFLIQDGKLDEAEALFRERAAGKDSGVAEAASYYHAQIQQRRGRDSESRKELADLGGRELVPDRPYRAYAALQAGILAQQAGEWETAAKSYQRIAGAAAAPAALREEALYRFADLSFLRSEFKTAAEACTQVLREWPAGVWSREAARRRAWCLLYLGGAAEGRQALEEWEKRFPDFQPDERDYVRGLLLEAQGKPDTALDAFRAVMERPGAGADWVRLARFQIAACLFRQQRWEAAVVSATEFRDAYPRASEKADAAFFAGIACRRLGRTAEAVRFLQDALAAAPPAWGNLVPAAAELGELLKESGQPKAAAAAWRTLAAREGVEGRSGHLLRAADLEQAAGDGAAAEADWRRLVKEFKDTPEGRVALLRLARLEAGRNQYKAAAGLAGDWLQKEPPGPERDRVLLFLGVMKQVLGESGAAEACFTEIVNRKGAEAGAVAEARLHLAECALDGKRDDAAVAAAEEVLAAPPGVRPVLSDALLLRLTELLFRYGRLDACDTAAALLAASGENVNAVRGRIWQSRVLGAKGQGEAARKLLAEVVDRAPAGAGNALPEPLRRELLSLLGELDAAAGQDDRAAGLFNEVLRPPAPARGEAGARARLGLARLYAKEGRTRQALEQAVGAFVLESDPAYTPPAMLLAVDLFVKDGKPADAVATWNELRQRYPAFAESRRDDPAVRALPAAK